MPDKSLFRRLSCPAILAAILVACGPLPARFDPVAWQRHLDESVALDLFPGVIAARFDAGTVDYWTAGFADPANAVPPTPDTFFQIGEVTGIFTVAAAFELVRERQLSWNTQAGAFLPAGGQPPRFADEVPILLRHLATHSADLPPLPLDLDDSDPRQPFAAYDRASLYRSLGRLARLNRPPGSHYQFSLFGMGLLGHVLELRTSQPYAEIVRAKVTGPLSLSGIVAEPGPDQAVAVGHKAITRVPTWDYGALVGGGGLFANAEALVGFTRAAANYRPNPLARTFQQMQTSVLPTEQANTWVGFGWHVTTPANNPLYWQSGQTAGHAAFVGFDLYGQRGVVVLTNAGESIEPLGFHLLAPEHFPLPALPQTARLSADTVARLAGVYRTEGGVTIRVRPDGSRLYVTFDDQPEYRVYAEGPLTFRYRTLDTRLQFARSAGPAPALTVVDGRTAVPARRISEDSAE